MMEQTIASSVLNIRRTRASCSVDTWSVHTQRTRPCLARWLGAALSLFCRLYCVCCCPFLSPVHVHFLCEQAHSMSHLQSQDRTHRQSVCATAVTCSRASLLHIFSISLGFALTLKCEQLRPERALSLAAVTKNINADAHFLKNQKSEDFFEGSEAMYENSVN